MLKVTHFTIFSRPDLNAYIADLASGNTYDLPLARKVALARTVATSTTTSDCWRVPGSASRWVTTRPSGEKRTEVGTVVPGSGRRAQPSKPRRIKSSSDQPASWIMPFSVPIGKVELSE